MVAYYDWINAQQVCPKCQWHGLGKDASQGEAFNDGVEYHCPKCDHRFGYIAFPLLTEAATDPRAEPIDSILAKHVLSEVARERSQPHIRAMARSHLFKLLFWLTVFLVVGLGCASIAVWAEVQHGWQSTAIQWIFGLGSALGGFGILFFGITVFAWIRGHKAALADAQLFEKDRAAFNAMHKDVIGPIPWG